MDLSGIIFVALALAWAVYLIPKALRHHDEIARTRSIDRFSTAMRVLARREPVNRRDTRLVVTPPRPRNPRVLVPTRGGTLPALPVDVEVVRRPIAPVPPQPSQVRRSAARKAARRRRRILALLILVTSAVAIAAGLVYVPWWSVAVPVGIVVSYLVSCRHQVRRESRRVRPSEPLGDDGRVDPAVTRRGARVDASYGGARPATTSNAPAPAETAPVPAPEAPGAVASPHPATGSLWDPVPITLPTYVTKARAAARTVRTIDLSEPRTWSSGRSGADSELVEQHAAEASKEATGRAVGS